MARVVTSPAAPAGSAAAPIVEQVYEGDQVQELPVEPTDERSLSWEFDQVQHRYGCPMTEAEDTYDDERPGRMQRMEALTATEPHRPEARAIPRSFRIIACLDCGARARYRLPTTFD